MYIIGGKSSTQMVRFSLPNVGQFRLRLGNFFEPLKCSAGHAEFSFNNPAKDFFCQKSKKIHSKSSENNYVLFLIIFEKHL